VGNETNLVATKPELVDKASNDPLNPAIGFRRYWKFRIDWD
jgi:hypothetical protein